MLHFLNKADYIKFASETNLDVILKQSKGVSGDEELLNNHTDMAVSDCLNFISSRYRTTEIFAGIKEYSDASVFVWNDLIYLDAGDFIPSTVYVNGEIVLYLGKVYRKNATTGGYVAGTLPTNATYFVELGLKGFYYITPPATYDSAVVYTDGQYVTYKFDIYKRNDAQNTLKNETPSSDSDYWEKIALSEYATEYDSTGNYPNNTTYWTYGDNRNQTIVRITVDIALFHLHSVINPRNIPALRKDRYDSAVEFLTMCMEGKLNPVLPEYDAQSGYKLRFGSNEPFNSIY
jgi:hypothetical protein